MVHARGRAACAAFTDTVVLLYLAFVHVSTSLQYDVRVTYSCKMHQSCSRTQLREEARGVRVELEVTGDGATVY
jgi:hypothetical protein